MADRSSNGLEYEDMQIRKHCKRRKGPFLPHRHERQHHHLGRNRALHLHHSGLPSMFETTALGPLQETRHMDVLVSDDEEPRAKGHQSAAAANVA